MTTFVCLRLMIEIKELYKAEREEVRLESI